MRIVKRILVTLLIVTFLCVALATGAGFYFYLHPSHIKSLVEKAASRATGTHWVIGGLSYSQGPISLQAENIQILPGDGGEGFRLEIPSLRLVMSLEGPFGSRTLAIRRLECRGPSISLSHQADFPPFQLGPESPSLLARSGRWLAAVLLFREIRVDKVRLSDGRIRMLFKVANLEIDRIHAAYQDERLVEATCSADLRLPSQDASLSVPLVRVISEGKPSLAGPGGNLLMSFHEARIQARAGEVREASGQARLALNAGLHRLSVESLLVRLRGIEARAFPAEASRPVDMEISGRGIVDLSTRTMEAPRLNLRVSDFLEWQGSVYGRFGPNPLVELRDMESRILPGRLLDHLPASYRSDRIRFALSGALHLKGSVSLSEDPDGWGGNCDLEGRFKDNPFSMAAGEISASGLIRGLIRAEGRFPGIRLSVNMEGSQGLLVTRILSLQSCETRVTLSGAYPRFEVQTLSLATAALAATAGGLEVEAKDIRLLARDGVLDAEARSLSLPDISLICSPCGEFHAVLEADREGGRIALKGEKTDLLRVLHEKGLLPGGWLFSGEESLRVEAGLRSGGEWTFSAQFGLGSLNFQGPDPSRLGEGISLVGQVEARGETTGETVSFASSAKAERGEVLLDRFYFNLADNEASVSCSGEYRRNGKTLELSELKAVMKDILDLTIRGSLNHRGSHPSFRILFHAPETPVRNLFQQLLLEPFKRDAAFLQELALGGRISADLRMAGEGPDWVLDGHIRWQDADLVWKDGLAGLKGMHIDLPLWIQRGNGHEAVTDGSSSGILAVDSLSLDPLPAQSLKMELLSGPNRLVVKRPTSIRVPGGSVQIGPMVWEDLATLSPSLRTSAALQDLDLHPLLSGLWSRPVDGLLSGSFDDVHFKNGTVTSRGEARARVFGGEVVVTNLGAEGILTSSPVVLLDARWKDLSLFELTRDTPFGRIQGLLRGHIRNLEIAHAQPQRFELLLETAQKKGVPQTISVMAVDNIARIGGGQSPFIGAAGLLSSFFRQFPYEKIGMRATLENDVFRINGTVLENDVEYIVKRGSFSGVNVVNQNPDNRISFKDMVKRIQRVGASGTAPVVQ
ncbi:MAG: hypothetical protein AB1512_10705 [Thermodesulfobacteriota bacterium]